MLSSRFGYNRNFEVDRKNIAIPANIRLADPTFDKPGKIDLLLGADCFWELLCVRQIKLNQNSPILHKTKLGWILAGSLNVPLQHIRCNFSKNISIDN